MTRLLTCGFETGDVNETGTNTIGSNGAITVVSSTPTPRAGSYCLKVGSGGSAGGTSTYKSISMGAAKTDAWIRSAIFMHGITAEMPFMTMYDAAAGAQANLQYNPTDGLVRAYRGATLVATASTSFSQDGWHVLEWRMQITSTTVGILEVWLDGNRVINFSGDNTNTTTTNVLTINLGNISAVLSFAAGAYFAYDDIAINDTAGTINNGRPQDGRVLLLSPSAAGSSTQLARGGTDTGANYSQVSEVPPSIAQYVYSATVGQRDLYALADIPVAVQSINVVEAIALAQNSDAGGGSIGLTVKSGATTNEATAIGLSTSAGYVSSRWETDPNTAAAWTVAGVNALEVGATVR